MKEALLRLFRSRKFLITMFDTVVSGMLIYFIGKYGSESLLQDVKFVIVSLQPIVIMLIGAIAYEDGQAKRSGNFNF